MSTRPIALKAWYQANANSTLTTTGIDAENIVAKEVQYDVGAAVTLSAAFSAVEANSYKVATPGAKLPTWHAAFAGVAVGESTEQGVLDYNALYGTTIVWDSENKPALPAKPAIFAPVELTNATGETWAYTAGGLQNVSANVNRDVYGVAKVTFTLSNTTSIVLSQVEVAKRTQTLSLTTDGNAKLLGSLEPQATTSRYAKVNSIDFVLTINANGSYSATIGGQAASETSSGSGVWELTFYYGMAPAYTTEQADVVGDHSSDAIKVVANPS